MYKILSFKVNLQYIRVHKFFQKKKINKNVYIKYTIICCIIKYNLDKIILSAEKNVIYK